MQLSTIKDAGEMEGGSPILNMQLTVKSAFDPKSGTNDYGDWSVQNTTVEDDTGTIKAAFFNPKVNLKNFIGQTITVRSGKDGKGKFSGIETYDYNNKKTGAVERQLKINAGATIDEATGGQGDAVSQPAQTQSPSTGANVAPVTRPAKVSYVEDSEVKRASIERQKALELAASFANSEDADEVITIAKKFYAFISGQGMPETPMSEPTLEIVKPEEETHADEVL